MATTYEKGNLYHLSIIDFWPNPNQPRKYFDPQALAELADSIRKHGILQPVLFCPGEQGSVTVVAGERRIAAAKMAGVLTIPAIMVEGNTDEIALVENLQRKDLTPLEEAEALDRIMKRHNYKQEDLTSVVGKSKAMISEIMSLNRLPEEIKSECRQDPSVPRTILVEIAKSKQERGMITLYNKYKEKQLSKEQLKEASRTKRKTQGEMLITSFDSMKNRLTAADADSISDEERNRLAEQANELKQTLDDFLTTIQRPNVDDEEPSPEGTENPPSRMLS
jgi:ParB family chromosome partitioning protein